MENQRVNDERLKSLLQRDALYEIANEIIWLGQEDLMQVCARGDYKARQRIQEAAQLLLEDFCLASQLRPSIELPPAYARASRPRA